MIAEPTTVFRWAPFAQIPVKPYVAAGVIKRIHDEKGRVDPADLVGAPELRPAFEWDDTVAARQHRENQARYILRSLVVVYKNEQGEAQPPIRYVVSLGESEEDETSPRPTLPRSYVLLTTAMSEEESRQRVIRHALAEAKAWRRRHEHIREFGRIFAAIDELAEAI